MNVITFYQESKSSGHLTVLSSVKAYISNISCNNQKQQINSPVNILYKSIAGRYRPVSYPDGPITARYTRQAHDVNTTSPQRRCNVMTLHRHWGDVVFTSCARWVDLYRMLTGRKAQSKPRRGNTDISVHTFCSPVRTIKSFIDHTPIICTKS